MQGIAGEGSRLTDGRPVALVHLDAHTDTYENIEHWMGARKSAALWAAYDAIRCPTSTSEPSPPLMVSFSLSNWFLGPSYAL